jgi:hypothetical protein
MSDLTNSSNCNSSHRKKDMLPGYIWADRLHKMQSKVYGHITEQIH